MKRHLYLLIAMAVIVSACTKDPEACINGTAAEGKVVTFYNCSTDAVDYDWDFGDGSGSFAQSPTHTYANYGTYQVSLRAANKKGKTSTVSQVVTIEIAWNQILTGNYTVQYTGNDGSSGSYTTQIVPKPGTTDQVLIGGFAATISNNGTTVTGPRVAIDLNEEMEMINGTMATDGSMLTITERRFDQGSSFVREYYCVYTR